MDKSSKNVLGYKVSGDVTKDDYVVLDADVAAAVKQYGSVNLLLDIRDFRWEKVNAWASDFDFGKTFKDSTDKMALVGDKTWEKYMAKLAQPFYAKEILYFENDDDAWEWLGS